MQIIRKSIDTHSQLAHEEFMYVCICNALRDRDLAEAAAQPGVKSAACVFKRCETKPKCGNCVPDIDEMVAQHRTANIVVPAE